jgi:hypothetical protein
LVKSENSIEPGLWGWGFAERDQWYLTGKDHYLPVENEGGLSAISTLVQSYIPFKNRYYGVFGPIVRRDKRV